MKNILLVLLTCAGCVAGNLAQDFRFQPDTDPVTQLEKHIEENGLSPELMEGLIPQLLIATIASSKLVGFIDDKVKEASFSNPHYSYQMSAIYRMVCFAERSQENLISARKKALEAVQSLGPDFANKSTEGAIDNYRVFGFRVMRLKANPLGELQKIIANYTEETKALTAKIKKELQELIEDNYYRYPFTLRQLLDLLSGFIPESCCFDNELDAEFKFIQCIFDLKSILTDGLEVHKNFINLKVILNNGMFLFSLNGRRELQRTIESIDASFEQYSATLEKAKSKYPGHPMITFAQNQIERLKKRSSTVLRIARIMNCLLIIAQSPMILPQAIMRYRINLHQNYPDLTEDIAFAFVGVFLISNRANKILNSVIMSGAMIDIRRNQDPDFLNKAYAFVLTLSLLLHLAERANQEDSLEITYF